MINHCWKYLNDSFNGNAGRGFGELRYGSRKQVSPSNDHVADTLSWRILNGFEIQNFSFTFLQPPQLTLPQTWSLCIALTSTEYS